MDTRAFASHNARVHLSPPPCFWALGGGIVCLRCFSSRQPRTATRKTNVDIQITSHYSLSALSLCYIVRALWAIEEVEKLWFFVPRSTSTLSSFQFSSLEMSLQKLFTRKQTSPGLLQYKMLFSST